MKDFGLRRSRCNRGRGSAVRRLKARAADDGARAGKAFQSLVLDEPTNDLDS